MEEGNNADIRQIFLQSKGRGNNSQIILRRQHHRDIETLQGHY